jgi:hypothetical protein
MSDAYQKSISRTNQGDGLDFWRTPPQATQALLDNEWFYGNMLEPACGLGDMSDVLSKCVGRDLVTSADIVNRGYRYQTETKDFLVAEMMFDNIITNPPFSLAEEFARKALELSTKKVALLLKLEFLQSRGRLDLFRTTPLKTVYVFPYRIPFHQFGYDKPINNQRHAWYVWEHGHVGNPELEWIKIPDEGVDKKWWK